MSFTPGISQTLGTPNGAGGLSYASHFYAADALGTLRGMTDGSAQGFSDGLNFDGFGNLVGRVGSTSTPLGYGEGSGYVTDADTGLRLLGHRYYDSRTGRFISQDPAGERDNWYIYADNDPVDGTDPSGLKPVPVGDGSETDDGSGDSAYTDDNGVTFTPVSVPITITGPNQYDTGTTSIHGGGSHDDAGPSVWQAAGAGFSVGFSAVGSAASFHLWNGGAARNDPSFGVSRGLADVGVAAGTAAFGGAAGTVGRGVQGTTTVSRWGRTGLQAGDWVMKGKANWWNYLRSFKWQPGLGNKFSSFKAGEEFQVPTSSVKWPTGGGIDGWWKGLFGQRTYIP